MPDQKPHLLKRWFEEVWNKGSEQAMDELAAPGIAAHTLLDGSGQPIAGLDKFKEFWRQFRDAFPDIYVNVEEALTDGDKEVVRCTVRATHRGAGLGLPPTQKRIQFRGVVIARVRDGRLVEAWDSWDFLGLYQQLGAVPAKLV